MKLYRHFRKTMIDGDLILYLLKLQHDKLELNVKVMLETFKKKQQRIPQCKWDI